MNLDRAMPGRPFTRSRALAAKILIALASLLLTGELTLYLFGYRANTSVEESFPGSMKTESDLGWVHVPGKFKFAGGGAPFEVTYWDDGTRATRASTEHGGNEVLLAGCSFVQGFGLGDSETFAWKLQELLPQYSVKNLGTEGYGTLQSLRAVKRYLAQPSRPAPAAVIYGFADFHALRNVKSPLYQRYQSKPGNFPYCTSDGCGTWPGKRLHPLLSRSRLFSFFENIVDRRNFETSDAEIELITVRLAEEFDDLIRSNQGRFYIAPVYLQNPRWLELFRQRGIETIECDSPELHQNSFRLPDRHPNERWSRTFAECLAKLLPAG